MQKKLNFMVMNLVPIFCELYHSFKKSESDNDWTQERFRQPHKYIHRTDVWLNLTSCCTEWAALQGFCYCLLREEIPAKSHFVSLSATKKLTDVRMEDKL